MREILFKAKRLDNGEWVEGTFTRIREKGAYSGISRTYPVIVFDTSIKINNGDYDKEIIAEIDYNTLCQYTGLLDMYGNKIFESDKFKEGDGFDEGVIEWSEEEAMFHLVFTDAGGVITHFGEWRGSEIQIIGNIHDKE